ncbi:hypothetical protein [Luteibacter sp. UNCMF366Tsu5.1]|uniref:hypothetical protein n=1 Tax=Luteibacter sp. UNCMF366Tsu5.1 TaxID=1502758 RepID=UPI000908FDB1|nr:hypothetical protein [Luteibacter sp. UNCMF366Tsu5.1]SFW71881.1 hypothetical protein SAMN02800691_3283 [Luteibacter sp. UNCMF366Tsu5.1]
MRDIVKAEWLRYQLWILAFAAVHLLVLVFFNRLTDLGQQPINVRRLFGAVYALTGILLGLHQMGSWRRPNQWINLLHRPVAPWRIGAGLLGAGTMAMLVAVALPIAIVVAWQVWGTARIVEMRQAILPVAAMLVAMGGYLAGAYGVLADRRCAIAGLVPLAWVAVSDATGLAALVVQALACVMLLAMVWIAFRPDLGEPPRTAAGMVVTAVPVQLAVYAGLLLLGFVGELSWIMLGTHPNNMGTPPRGGVVEAERMSGRERMIAGLVKATSPDAALWREQVVLSDVHALERQMRGVPTRGEVNNTVPLAFDDAETRTQWTFSHARMRFEGTGIVDGRRSGELGVGTENAAFGAIASPAGVLPGMAKGDVAIVAGNTLYQYLSATRIIVPRTSVPAGEWLLGTTPVGGSLAALTDRAVYLFDGRHLLDGDTPSSPRYRVDIPGKPGDLHAADLVELVDGYLLSFTFTERAHTLLGAPPYQTILWVSDNGRVTPVATRLIHQDFPALFRYKAWWSSPALYAVRQAATRWLAPQDPLSETAVPPIPDAVRMLAAALALLSLAIGGWFAVHRLSSLSSRIVWTLACGCIGIPALISLLLVVPRRERLVDASFRSVPAS